MKVFFKVFVVITVLVIVCSALKLVDLSVSNKYEVQEPIAMQKAGQDLLNKSNALDDVAFWLGITITYCLINICLLLWLLCKFKGRTL